MSTLETNRGHHTSVPRVIVVLSAAIIVVLLSVFAITQSSQADHESDNKVTFAPVDGSPLPNATGTGAIEYRGGTGPGSMWTTTFQYRDLAPTTTYSVVIQGRFGEDGSDDATAFTEICTFITDTSGDGGCWFYFVGLRHLGVVQLRLGAPDGEPILQATRKEGGPGSINSTTNDYSYALTATPIDDNVGATPGSNAGTVSPATP